MPNKNPTKKPLTTEQQIQQNELARSTIVGMKNGQVIRETNADKFGRLRKEAKSMTDEQQGWKEIKSARKQAQEARDAEAQSFYDSRQATRDKSQEVLDRLAKQVKSEIPKPSKPVMEASKRPANYKYLSDTEKRLIDLSLTEWPTQTQLNQLR